VAGPTPAQFHQASSTAWELRSGLLLTAWALGMRLTWQGSGDGTPAPPARCLPCLRSVTEAVSAGGWQVLLPAATTAAGGTAGMLRQNIRPRGRAAREAQAHLAALVGFIAQQHLDGA
jgi:hypothetical protein